MSTIWQNQPKAGGEGQGWFAGEADITAGIVTDPSTGLRVFAGWLGEGQSWMNQTKTSVTSWTNLPSTSGGISGGQPIGLLLALTYADTSAGTIWTNLTKI